MDFEVRDGASGRPADTLIRGDFALRVDGVARNFAAVEREAAPMDVVLIVDAAGEHSGFQTILRELRAGDRIGVISVNGRTTEVACALTGDQEVLRSAVSEVLLAHQKSRRGEPMLYESIGRAASLFGPKSDESRRRAIVTLTHNQTKPDRQRVARAVDSALIADASVMGIVVPMFETGRGRWRLPSVGRTTRADSRPDVVIVEGPRKYPIPNSIAGARRVPDLRSIDAVADQTGGDVLRYEQDSAAPWSDVMQRLRDRYMAAFDDPVGLEPGTVRNIDVRLTADAARRCPQCVVRARTRLQAP